jgi:hypothetical protein
MDSRILALALLTALLPLDAAAKPKKLKDGLSGIAKLGDRSFVGVVDRKGEDSKPRVLRVEITSDMSQRAEALAIDWASAGLPKDLEAVCALPKRAGEFLLLESGQVGPARLFHLVGVPTVGATGARVKGFAEVRLPAGARTQNLEGLACAPSGGGQVLVLFGERGGSLESPDGRLRWAGFDLATSKLAWTPAGHAGVTLRRPKGWEPSPRARAIADLHLDESGVLWAVAALDPEGDAGPFRSVVYRAGSVDARRERPVKLVTPEIGWRLDGFKIEGLAAPPKAPPGAAFSIATEDEDYGGAWRTLPRLSR